MLAAVAVLSATQLDNVTIFGLGIMPYISASIIFQLLGSVYPPLERLQKEGEAGRKKINEYTRYATVFICIIQSWVYVKSIVPGLAYDAFVVDPTAASRTLMFSWTVVAVLTMTAGTVFLMWIGEQIDEFGIGNGISLLIMAGILSAMPGAHVRRGHRRRRVYHARPTADSDAERQACSRSPRHGRHAPVLAAEGESGRRHADHFREQLAHVAGDPVRSHREDVRCQWLLGRIVQQAREHVQSHRVCLRPLLHRADLLLLLLLDGDHVQSEGRGGQFEELRFVHSGLPAWEANG
jgi:hypothetical protein